MEDITLKIEGMSCQHCVMSVKKALDALDGIESSEVSVGLAHVTYDKDKMDRETIASAVRGAGYRVVD